MMRLLTLAAGLATGYVLGTRAGRPKYDQIVADAQLLRTNPTAGQALTAVTNLFASSAATPATDAGDTATSAVPPAETSTAAQTAKPVRRRTTSATTAPSTPSE